MDDRAARLHLAEAQARLALDVLVQVPRHGAAVLVAVAEAALVGVEVHAHRRATERKCRRVRAISSGGGSGIDHQWSHSRQCCHQRGAHMWGGVAAYVFTTYVTLFVVAKESARNNRNKRCL